MAVLSPACRWPAHFDERGPAEDPSILLAGTAKLGDAQLQIVGIRVRRDSRRMPDYRADVPPEAYATDGFAESLDTLLQDVAGSVFEDALADSGSELVEFATGRYMLFIVPAGGGL